MANLLENSDLATECIYNLLACRLLGRTSRYCATNAVVWLLFLSLYVRKHFNIQVRPLNEKSH